MHLRILSPFNFVTLNFVTLFSSPDSDGSEAFSLRRQPKIISWKCPIEGCLYFTKSSDYTDDKCKRGPRQKAGKFASTKRRKRVELGAARKRTRLSPRSPACAS